MAGMFYTMQEVADKLSKSEEQIHELIQEGKLREFRDGTKLLFKVSEVEALASQLPSAANGEPVEIFPNVSEAVHDSVAESTPSAGTESESSDNEPEFDIDSIDLDSDDNDDLLLEPEGGEELSLEDSLSLLAGEDSSPQKSSDDTPDEEISLESDDLLLDEDSDDLLMDDDSDDLLLDDDSDELLLDDDSDDVFKDDKSLEPVSEETAEQTPEEPAGEKDSSENEFDDSIDILADDGETGEDIFAEPEMETAPDNVQTAGDISLEPEAETTPDDSMDILFSDDADDNTGIEAQTENEDTEDISLEAASEDNEEVLIADESSSDMQIDDGDSLKLAETTAESHGDGNTEDKSEEEFDLGDSFDILMEDDSDQKKPLEDNNGSLLSDDTLNGLLSTNAPESKIDNSDDEALSSLSKADTAVGNTGVNVLAESDGDFQLASDTKADTVISDDEDDDDLSDLDDLDDLDMSGGADSAGLGNLDDDLNLDSIGSGSGLLDLSLQADDTSLGAVLDDILPAEDDEVEAAPVEVDEGTISDEADKIFDDDASEDAMIPTAAAGGKMAVKYAEVPVTAVDNACGVAMFLPALMVVFSAIVLMFGLMEIRPKMLNQVANEVAGFPLIWWIVIGTSVLFLLILMFGALLGGGSGEKKPKVNKTKAKKAKKPKKAKKKK